MQSTFLIYGLSNNTANSALYRAEWWMINGWVEKNVKDDSITLLQGTALAGRIAENYEGPRSEYFVFRLRF
jgi:hypothetical protein